MRSAYVLIALMLSLQTPSVGQQGYIVIDSAYTQGFVSDQGLFTNNREVKFTLKKKDQPKVYSPNQAREYGFDDKAFVSKVVQEGSIESRYFLQRLADGQSKLYLLKTRKGKRLFTEVNSTLEELNKDSFRDALASMIVKNENLRSQVRLVKFRQKSLTRFFLLNNQSYTGLFPTFRKGILGGISSTSMSVIMEDETSVSLGNDISPFVGAFIEVPVGLKPKTSLSIQAIYRENSYNKFVDEANNDLDLLVNTASLNFPVLIKYHSTSIKFRRYFILGPSFTYYLKNECQGLQTTSTGSIVEINRIPVNSIPQYQAEAVLGFGFEYSIMPKNSAGLELRYGRGFGAQSLSSFQLVGTIYF